MTPRSLWQTLAAEKIDDDLLAWPPDVFALTAFLLQRSEAYRFVLSPPPGGEWPPAHLPPWADAVVEAGAAWSARVDDGGPPPRYLADAWKVLAEGADTPLSAMAHGSDWPLCRAVLTLHAIADEACAGLGNALDVSSGLGCVYRAQGRELLSTTGSLARVGSHLLRVLPKLRTPPTGSSAETLSRYACLQPPGAHVRWHRFPSRPAASEPRSDHVNFLLLPWPMRIRESDFRPVDGSLQRNASEPTGLFEFDPVERIDLDLLDRVLLAAKDEVESVDAVCLPESSVREDELANVEAMLDRHGVSVLFAGVRQTSSPPSGLPHNWVHTGINPNVADDGTPVQATEPWLHIRQNKHHRWSLDESQVFQYHLGGSLHPKYRWWEAMEVPRQAVQFMEFREFTCVFLVCEDLAQGDDVTDIVRSVGPTAVFAPLLDGPQLSMRWAARYASVLADDPGSAVLTLTSFGMVERSRPHGRAISPVVAMWKDPTRGTREIPLEPGSHGVLLTACADRTNRRTIDGRRPVATVSHLYDVSVNQVRAAVTGGGPLTDRPTAGIGATLSPEDLSVLTSWTQAVAEAVASAPEHASAVLGGAQAGVPWRECVGTPKISRELAQALRATKDAFDSVSKGAHDTLEGIVAELQNNEPQGAESRLPFRALSYAFESRQARELRREAALT